MISEGTCPQCPLFLGFTPPMAGMKYRLSEHLTRHASDGDRFARTRVWRQKCTKRALTARRLTWQDGAALSTEYWRYCTGFPTFYLPRMRLWLDPQPPPIAVSAEFLSAAVNPPKKFGVSRHSPNFNKVIAAR